MDTQSDEAPFALLEPDTVIVLYDPKTGAVKHVHQEVTQPGGSAPPREKQLERAIALAREHPERANVQFKVMYVAPTTFRELRGEALAVDLKAGILKKRRGSSDGGKGTKKAATKKKSSTGSRKPLRGA